MEGNVYRKAIERIKDGILSGECSDGNLSWIVNLCDDALAQPKRNCDVGTVEEQYKRFKRFCFCNMGDGMNEPRCSKCPLGKAKFSCKFDWAQMPYGKGDER